MATESILKDFYLQDDAAVDRFRELLEMPPIPEPADASEYSIADEEDYRRLKAGTWEG